MRALLIISLLLITNISHAETDKENMLKIADEFAFCAGTFKSASKNVIKMGGTKDIASLLDGSARGAQVASEYLLSSAHSDGKKPLGEYKDYVDSIAYTSELKMNALYDINNKDSQAQISSALNICVTLSPLQAQIVQELRQQTHLPK